MAISTIGQNGLTVPLTTAGSFGVGTASPASPLQVNTAGVNTTVQINSTDANGGYGANIALNNTGTGGRQYALFSTSNADGDVGGGKLKFYDLTAGATRMLIDSSGNFFVNQTSLVGAEKLGISYDRTGSWGMSIRNTTGTTQATTYVSFKYVNTETGTITSSGSNTAYNTSSDYRLKDNVTPMTGALNTVSLLNPVTWKWKSTGVDGQGFIAHELQEVVPDCVHGEKDAVDDEGNPKYQGVDVSYLVATLAKAIQELKTIVDAQAAEIAELKAKVNA